MPKNPVTHRSSTKKVQPRKALKPQPNTTPQPFQLSAGPYSFKKVSQPSVFKRLLQGFRKAVRESTRGKDFLELAGSLNSIFISHCQYGAHVYRALLHSSSRRLKFSARNSFLQYVQRMISTVRDVCDLPPLKTALEF